MISLIGMLIGLIMAVINHLKEDTNGLLLSIVFVLVNGFTYLKLQSRQSKPFKVKQMTDEDFKELMKMLGTDDDE